MELLLDGLLGVGAVGAAIYCFVLARRLKGLSDLDKGVGGAIAVLSLQVDELQKALKSTETRAAAATQQLEQERERADAAVREMRLILASLHDLSDQPARPVNTDPFYKRKEAV